YAGRAPGDAAGTLSAETVLKAGVGSQSCPRFVCSSLSRWGDYSAMTVDPVDDCTFWYTNEYEKTTGAFNWSTWISSFKFPGCGTTVAPVLTSIQVSPPTASVQTGQTRQFTATAYDQFSQPLSPQPSLMWTVSGGGTISQTGLFTAGSTAGGPFTVTASSGSVNGTASVTVTPPPAPDFSLSASPGSRSIRQGTSTTYTVTVVPVNGFAGSVALTASGLPVGASASFGPTATTTTSTMTVTTSSASRGTSTITITGTSGSLTHTTTVKLTITKH
ncbi:MAG: Ig-like domain-containing protein, partial [Chloroflexota bacterium]